MWLPTVQHLSASLLGLRYSPAAWEARVRAAEGWPAAGVGWGNWESLLHLSGSLLRSGLLWAHCMEMQAAMADILIFPEKPKI